MATSPTVVDVDAVLDRVRFRGLPVVVLVCAAVVLALDGFDIQVIGFVAPALTAEFGVERSALGPVLAASLIGMALGALGVGPVGDRFGRRSALLASTLLFSAGTLLGSTAGSLEALTVWRFLTGIGLGGALPNSTALIVEFSPPRWRNQAVAAAIVGVPVGGMIGATFAAEVITLFGWRAIFVLGGALPLLWLVFMYFVLPESPRYLATRADQGGRLAAILNRIDESRRYGGDETFVLGSSPVEARKRGIGALFTRALVRDTLAAWIVFATNVFAVYAFFNWAPVVLTSLGLDLATAVRGAFVFNASGVVGALVLSWLISRFGSRWPLAAFAAIAAASLAWLAWLAQPGAGGAPPSVPLAGLMLGVAVAGFTILSLQVGMYAVSAHIYPTECRSSGVGWALGIGRLGGIVSSFAGGFLMAGAAGEGGFFLGIAAVMLLTFASVIAIRRHIPAAVRTGRVGVGVEV